MKVNQTITRLNKCSKEDVFHVLDIYGIYSEPSSKAAWNAYKQYKNAKVCHENQDNFAQEVHRYYLELQLEKNSAFTQNKDVLVALMMNPSATFYNEDNGACEIDPTVQNVCRLAYASGYFKVVALNCFSLIEPNSEVLKTKNMQQIDESSGFECSDKNLKYIKNALVERGFRSTNTDIDLLLATGNNPVPEKIFDVLKSVKDSIPFYVFALNKTNTPKHLSLRVPRNRELIDDVIKQGNLTEVEVDWCDNLKENKLKCNIKSQSHEDDIESIDARDTALVSFERITDDSSIDDIAYKIVDKKLVEIKDVNVLARLDSIIPNFGMAIANGKLVAGGVYKAIIPVGETLSKSNAVPGAFRGFCRDANGITGHASFVKLKGVPIMNTVMSVASIVVGQYYMTQINNQLGEINKQLNKISSFQETEYKGKICVLMGEMHKYSKYSVEIIENEELRLRELDNLRSLEHECKQLLAQANLILGEYEDKPCKKFKVYEKKIKEDATPWFLYQRLLLKILQKIAELTYTLNLGNVSAEYCYSTYHLYEEQANNALEFLRTWHLANIDKFNIDVVLKDREREGVKKLAFILGGGMALVGGLGLTAVGVGVASVVAGLFSHTKISDETFSMILEQMIDSEKSSGICEADLLQKDVTLVTMNGKVYMQT